MPSASLYTPLTRILAIRHPVLLAPMAGVSGGALANAVTQAGGLGIIGGGYGDENWLNEQFMLAENTSVGIGFITWSLARKPQLLDIALSYKPRVVFLSFGDARPYAEAVKSADIPLIMQVQSIAQAREALELGANILVAQGGEAGGHGAGRGTLPLVPAIVDCAGDVPVVAAGGIADGRGLAAALMLGACGVLLGSRFYASTESLARQAAKDAAVDASGDDTTKSSVYDHLRGFEWPDEFELRTLKNRTTDDWFSNREVFLDHLSTKREALNAALEQDDFEHAPVIVGEVVDLIRDVSDAGEILHNIVQQATALLTCLPHVEFHPQQG